MANTMSREAFEAWLNPGHHAGNVSPWVEPGRYQKDTHQLAWLAWQAAQADAYERAVKIARGEMQDTSGSGNRDADDAARRILSAIEALKKEVGK